MRKPLPPVLVLTTAFEGLRAGAGTFRLCLDLPARHRIGPLAFAEFSRATDLSPQGVLFYILYGIGGAILTVLTWSLAERGKAPAPVRYWTGTAALCSLAVLLLTTQAAPLMWQVGSAPPDAALLTGLFDRFTFWTGLRVLCVDVSFASMLAALSSRNI